MLFPNNFEAIRLKFDRSNWPQWAKDALTRAEFERRHRNLTVDEMGRLRISGSVKVRVLPPGIGQETGAYDHERMANAMESE